MISSDTLKRVALLSILACGGLRVAPAQAITGGLSNSASSWGYLNLGYGTTPISGYGTIQNHTASTAAQVDSTLMIQHGSITAAWDSMLSSGFSPGTGFLRGFTGGSTAATLVETLTFASATLPPDKIVTVAFRIGRSSAFNVSVDAGFSSSGGSLNLAYSVAATSPLGDASASAWDGEYTTLSLSLRPNDTLTVSYDFLARPSTSLNSPDVTYALVDDQVQWVGPTVGFVGSDSRQSLGWAGVISVTDADGNPITDYTLVSVDGLSYKESRYGSVATITDPVDYAASFGFTGGDTATTADPDNDGLKNLLEFILGGNPATADAPSVQPVTSVSGGFLTLTFQRLDASEAAVALSVETSTNLSTWDATPIGSTSSSGSGGVIVTVTENGAANDTVLVQVPLGTSPSLFARLSAQ